MEAKPVVALATILFASSGVTAQELPPIPADLQNSAAIACVKIDDGGNVTGAFLIGSAGGPTQDQEFVAWVKQLHWPAAKPGEKGRNSWFPMPVTFGSAKAPNPPSACGPNA